MFARDVSELLKKAGVDVVWTKIGDYMTSIDMAGLSLTLIRLKEPEWLDALNSDVETPAW